MSMSHEAEVARRAYEIWEREGRPHGVDLEHWLRAEAELAAPPKRKSAPRAKKVVAAA
jgi:hypothetical protein